MSALGQKQTCAVQLGDVRFVPIADMRAALKLLASSAKSMGKLTRHRHT